MTGRVFLSTMCMNFHQLDSNPKPQNFLFYIYWNFEIKLWSRCGIFIIFRKNYPFIFQPIGYKYWI